MIYALAPVYNFNIYLAVLWQSCAAIFLGFWIISDEWRPKNSIAMRETIAIS